MGKNLPVEPCDGGEHRDLHVEHDDQHDVLRYALGRYSDNGDDDDDVRAGAYVVHVHLEVVLGSSIFPLLFINSL